MLHAFMISFRLKDTYRANTIIYSLKQFPLIKYMLPLNLYQSRGLKIFAHIISTLYELASVFIGKMLYMYIMIFYALSFYEGSRSDLFVHILFFLTINGALINSYMFNPTKDKYYAMMIMKMDARKYTLSNYYYALLKLFVGMIPFSIILGKQVGLPLWLCLLLPLFVVMMKMNINAWNLRDFKKKKRISNENKLTALTYAIIAGNLLLAYALPLLDIYITVHIFMILSILTVLLGLKSAFYIAGFNEYKMIYKQLLTEENVYVMENATGQKAVKKQVEKKISFNPAQTSQKSGYAFFHELFFIRHRKILTDAIKKQTIVIVVLAILTSFAVVINIQVKMIINMIIMTSLPYFLFVMYLINRGQLITQAMFMNCDHSMLTYRIYRTPRVILNVFKERIKTVVLLNLIPAVLLGISLAWLLYLSGGTNVIMNYLIIIVSIASMSIFFSVHYLVLYYLLQPYNIKTEIKSSTYSIIQGLTYFICYFMMGQKLPTFMFGIVTIAISVIYIVISLILVYRLAPKTFKIRT